MMGDRAMMSAYYPKSGQRPEDNVRAIADALAVYLAWSFRNSITQVKKATSTPTDAPASPIDFASVPVTTLRDELAPAETVIAGDATDTVPDRASELSGELSGESTMASTVTPAAAESVATGRPLDTAPAPEVSPIGQPRSRYQSVNLQRIAQRRRSKLQRR